jgi:hypothetical protein
MHAPQSLTRRRKKSVTCIFASISVLTTRENDDMIIHFRASKSTFLLISGIFSIYGFLIAHCSQTTFHTLRVMFSFMLILFGGLYYPTALDILWNFLLHPPLRVIVTVSHRLIIVLLSRPSVSPNIILAFFCSGLLLMIIFSHPRSPYTVELSLNNHTHIYIFFSCLLCSILSTCLRKYRKGHQTESDPVG